MVGHAAACWRPWLVYAATLFLSSGLLFAVHVPNGTFLHSAVALMPYAYLLTLAGVGGVVAWWPAPPELECPRATRVFGAWRWPSWWSSGSPAVVPWGRLAERADADAWR